MAQREIGVAQRITRKARRISHRKYPSGLPERGTLLIKNIAIFAAALMPLLAAGTALAHEPRDIQDYNLVVGFLHEPAFEGLLNGVSLRVTKPAPAAHAYDGHAHGQEEHADTHAATSHEPLESEIPVSVDIETDVEDGGGVNVRIMAERWKWAPRNVNAAHIPGEGHAHIYVNGEKLNRVYGPYYHIPALSPGAHEIRVTLNANSHNDLTLNGEPIEATATVTTSDAAHNHASHAHAAVEADAAMSIEVAAHPDPLGGYNLHVMPQGFAFSGGNVNGKHIDGEGYGQISVDGEPVNRTYGEWFKLPALQPGMRTIEVALFTNNHSPYTWRGAPVKGEVVAHVAEDGSDHGGHAHQVEHSMAQPANAVQTVGVEGLENTLIVEVTHAPSGVARTMTLYADADDVGHYKADFIPTASGQYIFHFSGSIEGVAVDERFESGVGTFDDVRPAVAIQFPESAAAAREIEAAVRGAQDAAQQAQSAALSADASAARARMLGIGGIALGAVGIAFGAVASALALRRRSSAN